MRIPKYRRNGDGRAFVYHPTIPTKSHRMYLGTHGSPESLDQYRRWLALFEAAGGRHPLQETSSATTLVELAAEYLDHAERYYSVAGKPTKEFGEIRRAVALLLELFDALPVAEFGPRALSQLQQHMCSKGYARIFINHQVGRIKRMFRWLCREELTPADLYHRLSTVSGLRKGRTTAREPEPVQPVDWNDVAQTLPWLSPTVATMVQVQYLCGMRPGEVCLMSWETIDRSRPDLWLYFPPSHKTGYLGHSLTKPVPGPAQQLLRDYLHKGPREFLFSPRDAFRWRISQTARSGECRSIPSRIRDHYDTGSYAHAIVYGIQKAARQGVCLNHWHPHQLRHAIATSVRQIAGEEAAQVWLGHANIATTGRYTAKQIRELEQVSKRVQGVLPPAATGSAPSQTNDRIDDRTPVALSPLPETHKPEPTPPVRFP